jgi:hypothetical protein
MDLRIIIVVAAAVNVVSAFAQTQPTRPSAYPSYPTLPSAFATSALSPCYSSFNRTSPCYSGTFFSSYSAVMPFEFKTKSEAASQGADSLNEDRARWRIEAKGYSNVSGLQKDSHGIWRGKATSKDGKRVVIILDLEGNIYSELDLSRHTGTRPAGGRSK